MVLQQIHSQLKKQFAIFKKLDLDPQIPGKRNECGDV
jgi:hypothetical protein